MSWPVRSRLLYQTRLAAPGVNVVRYSAAVPAGKTWLIKDIAFWYGGAGSQGAYLYSEAGGVLYTVFSAIGFTAGSVPIHSGRSIVLPAGHRIGWSVNLNGDTALTVSGAELG